MLSGTGSNFSAIIDYLEKNSLAVQCLGVISDNPKAKGLELAEKAKIRSFLVDYANHLSRDSFEFELGKIIDYINPDLIVLAGFMRVLSKQFTERFAGMMINIHPSLLPKFKGLHTHRNVIANQETEHGASIHFVTSDLDGGPIISQASLWVNPKWNEKTLAKKVLVKEHQLFPLTIRLFADGRIQWNDGNPLLDGKPLLSPILLEELIDEYHSDRP